MSVGQLLLHVFLGIFLAFVLGHHVLGAVSDCGEFPVDFDQGCVGGWEFDADSSFVDIPHSPDFIEGAFVLTLRGAHQHTLNHLHFRVFFSHALGQLDLLSGQKFHHLECGAELQPSYEFMRHIRDFRVRHNLIIGDQGSFTTYSVACKSDICMRP